MNSYERGVYRIFILVLVILFSFSLMAAHMGHQVQKDSSCVSAFDPLASAFGTARDKGDMRIIRVLVPSFYSNHSVLTSWGAGFNKVQLI